MSVTLEEADVQESRQTNQEESLEELDRQLLGALLDDARRSEHQDANSSAAQSPAPTVPPNLSGANESGAVEGDNPDSDTERHVASEDASAHIDDGSDVWDWWQNSRWRGWDHGAQVPIWPPTQS